ncbi:MAG: hypothetical protein HY850_06635 [Betaproteobacteria bacterium]|nr:hypothetical protein [Betaproteobacteria bacterium]
MKRFIFVLAALFATAAQASTFSIPYPCEGGGSRTLNGDWDATTGAITWTMTLNNCRPDTGDSTTMNGTITASGQFLNVGGNSYNANLQDTTSITLSGGTTGNLQCSRSLSGTWDIATRTATNVKITLNNCNITASQSLNADIVELIGSIPLW